MRRRHKKWILSIGLTSVISTSVITSFVLLSQKKTNSKSSLSEFKEKINNLSNKMITIDGHSGTVNENKKEIIKKILELEDFPINEKNIFIDIENNTNEIIVKGTPFIILLKNENLNIEKIKGFKVKRLQTQQEIDNDKNAINKIKNKIQDKNLTILKTVDTSDDAKILKAIQTQLQINNSYLTDDDLSKITDNILSLTPGTQTPVTLTITVGTSTDTIQVQAIRPKNDQEIDEDITAVKNALIALSVKEVTIADTDGTITSKKAEILIALQGLEGYSSLDLKGTTVAIRDEDTILTVAGVGFAITISKKGRMNTKITAGFTVKRSKTDKELVAEIKDKIQNTYIKISKDTDTSDDVKLLKAIKDQLKLDNDTLTDDDLSKITSKIKSLELGKSNIVKLDIRIGQQLDTIVIIVDKDLEYIDAIIKRISIKNFDISPKGFAPTDEEYKKSIKLALLKANPNLKYIDLKYIEINLPNKKPKKTPIEIDLKIKIKNEEKIIKIIVTIQPKTTQELVAEIKDKIQNTYIKISKDTDTSDDAKLLKAIKNQLKIDNDTLTDNDLSKITDSISSLTPGIQTSVILTIIVSSKVDAATNTIQIKVTRPKTIKEKLENIELQIAKETTTNDKATILAAIKARLETRNILTSAETAKIIDISIDSLTPKIKTSITLTIRDDSTNYGQTISIEKSLTTVQLNTTQVKSIKNKIQNKNLIISKDIDTSDDAKLLKAIKNQLKIDNDTLTDNDLSKITDSISSLTPGIQTLVTLTIIVGNSNDTIQIQLIKNSNAPAVTVAKIKGQIKTNENLIINKQVYTSNKVAILVAIKEKLVIDKTLNSDEARKITDISISSLTPGIQTLVTLTITVGNSNDTIQIKVTRPKTIKEKLENIELQIAKETPTNDEQTILAAIKARLETRNILTSAETAKIIDISIDSLTPKIKTSITLTIRDDSTNYSQIIFVTKSFKTDVEIIKLIKDKIQNTDLTINKDADTSTDDAILVAIKNQLKTNNPSLTYNNFLKITDSISSLTPGIQTLVTLTITVGNSNDTIQIKVTRPKTIKEKLENIELQIAKETTTNDEATILAAIKARLETRNILTSNETGKITNISINSLTLGIKTSITLTIRDNSTNYSQIIFVTKSIEKQGDNASKSKQIKAKIKKTDLIINKDVNTSTDNEILSAIKNQLQIDNPSLTNDDLTKITDNISSVISGTWTLVILTIQVGTEIELLQIQIIKTEKDIELVKTIKDKITNTNLIINKDVNTSTDDAILVAIKNQLKTNNPSLTYNNFLKITDSISSLTPGIQTLVILTITVGNSNDTIQIKVTKTKTIREKLENVELKIGKEIPTNDKTNILAAIKERLKNRNILNSSEAAKITGISIYSLTAETKTLVTLTIRDDSINIYVTKLRDYSDSFKIKAKIQNINLIINKDADTSTDDAILVAIKTQLQIDNPSLTNDDLAKITDNISSLIPITQTDVTLTITVGNSNDTIQIKVTRPKTIKEKLENVELKIGKDTPTNDKATILAAIKVKLVSDNILTSNEVTKIIGISINSLDSGVLTSITLTIKENLKIKINVKKQTTDERDIAIIKAKINANKGLTIAKNVDTSNKTNILAAIKAQLVSDNILTPTEITKITDISINSLTPGLLTSVTLTITLVSQSGTKNIIVKKERTNSEIVATIKAKINANKDLRIAKNVDTSTDANILIAIKAKLKSQNNLNDKELLTITDNISLLTVATRTNVILTITVGSGVDSVIDTITITLIRPKTIKEKLENVELQIAKETVTNDKATILAVIKAQLVSDNILTPTEITKITDISINSLTPGIQTLVTLTITVGNSNDTIQIKVTRPKTIKEKLENVELQIAKETVTNDKATILAAIKAQLVSDNILTPTEITKITDISINSLTPGLLTSVTLTITLVSQSGTKNIIVKKERTNSEIVATIKAKINANKDLTIAKNVDTSDKTNILAAIKAKLESDGTLNSNETGKITDISINSLTPGIQTLVTLTITVGNSNDTIQIKVTRPKTIKEKLENVELQIAKETVTNDKATILAVIKAQLVSDNILTPTEITKITDISINSLTPGLLTSVTLTITLNNQPITQTINVKKERTNSEIVATIKAKINANKDLRIAKNVDTSTDTNILIAIKAKLKSQNNLNDKELLTITDNIALLKAGTAVLVSLTITVGSGVDSVIDTITITLTRPKTIKEKLENNIQLQIAKETVTNDKATILAAIKAQLVSDNILTPTEITKITDISINSLTSGLLTSVTLTIVDDSTNYRQSIFIEKLK